jgi:hypothetical protein
MTSLLQDFNIKYLIFLFAFSPFLSFAQDAYHKKGEMYFSWGYNRDYYTKSDINFRGDEYDFTLYDVIAQDRQSEFDFNTYFGIENITIPQFNMRLGVYINEKYDISFGDDHMKYVMQSFQKVKMQGEISNSNTKYDGVYDKEDFQIEPDFLRFEHTDGLNYLNLEIRRTDILFARPKFRIETRIGGGAGVLMPRTNATLLNNPRHDEFHFSGWGTGVLGGLHFSLFKHLFFQFEAKGGFIQMPDIRTTENPADRASQYLFFSQFNGVIGVNFNLIKEKK